MCGLVVMCELLTVAGLSDLEATRVMGGNWGGNGDMGEPVVKLALSGKRGDATYSVFWDGGDSG